MLTGHLPLPGGVQELVRVPMLFRQSLALDIEVHHLVGLPVMRLQLIMRFSV